MCDPASIAMTAVSVGGQLLSSRAANRANDQNAQLARENAALTRETQARNEALIREQLGQNSDLITGARDQVTGLNTSARDQTQQTLDANRTENFGLLEGTRDINTRVNDQTRADVQGLITGGRDTISTLNQQTAARNQGELQSTARQIQAENVAARDANTALYREAGAANEGDIRQFGDKAAGAIQSVMDESRGLYTPYVQQGTKATDAISALLGLGGDVEAQERAFENFRKSSGYDFQVKEAERGVMGNQAAQGLLESGSALKALSDRRQGLADASFGDYFGRLEGQQRVGLNATDSLTSRLAQGAGDLASTYQRTGSDLAGNRNTMASGLANTNINYLAGTTAAANNYQTGTVNNNNALLGNQTNNINNATEALGNTALNYSRAQTDNQNDFASGVLRGNDAHALGTIANASDFTTRQGGNLTGSANALAGLNTSSANALVGGNNALLQGLTGANGQLMGVNNDRGATNASMWAGFADTVSGRIGQWRRAQQQPNPLLNATPAATPISLQNILPQPVNTNVPGLRSIYG